MGATNSKTDGRLGRLDGRAVEFEYARDGDRKKLTYGPATGAKDATIDAANIVGCVKAPYEGPDSYTVFYVQGSNEPPDTKTDQAAPAFKSVVAQNLPESFVADYLIQPDRPTQQQRDSRNGGVVRIHVVISTLSGTGLAEGFYENNVKPLFQSIGLREDDDYAVHRTKSAKTILELTHNVFLSRANDGIAQRIILLSGDGGIVDVTNGLLSGTRRSSFVAPSVALIPMGTGNALAHSSGITKDNTLGLATLARGTPVRLPLLKASFSAGARLLVEEGSREEVLPPTSGDDQPTLYGAVVCSWAMHAGLVADSDTAEYRKYGIERFKMAAKEALYPAGGSEPHRYRANVSLLRTKGGKEIWKAMAGHEHAYVLATLVSNLEKTFTISPASRPLDGHLRLVHFGPMPSDEVMRVMGLAYQDGKHVHDAEVGYEDVEGIRISFDGLEEDARWRRICVDGKIVRVERDGWVEVRKEPSHVIDLVCLR